MARSLSIALLLLGLAGCVTLSRPAPPTYQYRLDYPAPAADAEPLPVVVRVARFHAAELYARTEIVYREEDHRLASYAYHRWATDPASMIGALIARDLASSGAYRVVLRGPSPVRSDYEIDAEVEVIEERSGPPCTAHVEIRAVLLRTRGSLEPVVFQRPYAAEEPCAGNDPAELVAASSRAVASVSDALRRDVHAAIAADFEAGARGEGRGARRGEESLTGQR
jgi:ABC-type uncharacterized transport system auxiliary subunit